MPPWTVIYLSHLDTLLNNNANNWELMSMLSNITPSSLVYSNCSKSTAYTHTLTGFCFNAKFDPITKHFDKWRPFCYTYWFQSVHFCISEYFYSCVATVLMLLQLNVLQEYLLHYSCSWLSVLILDTWILEQTRVHYGRGTPWTIG